MYSLALIIFVVSEKKAFEYFPIGSNVNLYPAVAAIFNFQSALKKQKLCRGPSIDHSWVKAKLYMHVHWMVLCKLHVFYSDMKFKMATTAGLSLTLDPMGKMFQNASSHVKTMSCSGSHLGITINIKTQSV
jgi:hypothetical protein